MLGIEESVSAATGAVTKQVNCEACGHQFSYLMRSSEVGYGYSFFLLGREEARKAASEAAIKKVENVLQTGKDVPCPECGWLQASMVELARQRGMLIWYWWTTAVAVALGSALLFTPYVFIPWYPAICIGIALVIVGLPLIGIRKWNPNRRLNVELVKCHECGKQTCLTRDREEHASKCGHCGAELIHR